MPSVISTTVVGGVPPRPWQCNLPEQSPVAHKPCPFALKLQCCLPHILPDHLWGTSMTASWPLMRWKPPSFGVGCPAPPKIPGHILSLQLFTTMSWYPMPSANDRESGIKQDFFKIKNHNRKNKFTPFMSKKICIYFLFLIDFSVIAHGFLPIFIHTCATEKQENGE